MRDEDASLADVRRSLEAATSRCLPAAMASHRDDVIQLAMLKATAAMQAGRPITKRWLARVAYTTMIDELRRNRVGREDPSDDGVVEVAAEQQTPEEQTGSAELGDALERCMSGLAPRARRSITLFLAGHQANEIAKVISATTKSVQHMVSRARTALRTCLSSKGFAPGGVYGR